MTREPRDWDGDLLLVMQATTFLLLVASIVLTGVAAYQRHQAEIAVMLKEKK